LARAAFFSSVSLTGNFGTASTELSGLFAFRSRSLTPGLRPPILAGGANVANLDLAKVEKNVQVAQYEKPIKTAFREVVDALAARGPLIIERTLVGTGQPYSEPVAVTVCP
jgi:outer membrane protein TolC